jgi:hypothetical protein
MILQNHLLQRDENNTLPKKIIISTQAYLSMVSEVNSYSDTETGGIFLGTIENNSWYIIESIDPGYKDSIRHQTYFEYDIAYVNHLANIRNRLYTRELILLGLWHRHPGSMDTFSGPDKETNKRFTDSLPNGSLSALINIDPIFRITMYHISSDLHYITLKDIVTGDEHVPREYLKLKDPEYYLEKINIKNKRKNTTITKLQERLISVFEEESKYLYEQKDYIFEVQMLGTSIQLEMRRTNADIEIPKTILAIFSIDKDKVSVQFNDNSAVRTYEYRENIIQKFIDAMRKKAVQKDYQPEDLNKIGEFINGKKNAKQ